MEKKIRKRKLKGSKTQNNIHRQLEIYRKALDLFVEKGYDATSLSMIARRSGISKANLYYYCPSKEDLLYQIHLNDLESRFVPIIEAAEKESDPKKRLVHFLREFTFMCTSSPASRVLVHEVRSLKKGHRDKILSIWGKAYTLMRRSIVEMQESGEAQRLRDSFLAFLGAGMVFWIVYWWDYRRQDNAEELADTLVKIFLEGLETRTGKIKSKVK